MTLRKKILLIREKNQRRFRIVILPNSNIFVYAPMRTTQGDIFDFLNKNKVWIQKTLHKINRAVQFAQAKSFSEGESLVFMGKEYKIVEKNVVGVEFFESKFLAIPKCLNYRDRKKHIFNFFKEVATRVIHQRISYYSAEMNLRPKSIKFRNNKTTWGACQPDNTLVFNWKLIAAPLAVIDYVIVHELAHMRERNHSPRFWAIVAQVCPEYVQIKKWLRKNYYTLDFLNNASEVFESKMINDAKREVLSIDL